MKKKLFKLPQLSQGSSLIDTHCHLDMEDYSEDLDDVISAARKTGVHHIITIGIDLPSSLQAVAIAEKYENLYATIGVHPHNATDTDDQDYENLKELARKRPEKIVGYGEIGLDYVKKHSPAAIQKKQFRKQLVIAKELHLPVIIHDRGAHADTINLLNEAAPFPAGGVMHCFSGDIHLARQVLALGFYISIPGIVTFPNAGKLQEAAGNVPLQRLLLETDGPFLTPVPFRGKRNLPEYLSLTAAKVADLKKISIDEVADATTYNATRLFGFH